MKRVKVWQDSYIDTAFVQRGSVIEVADDFVLPKHMEVVTDPQPDPVEEVAAVEDPAPVPVERNGKSRG